MSETSHHSFWARLGAPQAPPPWGLVDVVTTLGALLIGLIFLGTGAALWLFSAQVSAGAIAPLALLLGWCIGLLAVLLLLVIPRQRDTAQWAALRLNPPVRLPLAYVLLLGVGVALLVDVLAGGGAGFRPVAPLTGIGGGLGEWLGAGFFIVVLQPLTEGLAFYGIILPRLRASLGPYGGLLATAGLYALVFALVYGAALTGAAFVWYGILMPLVFALFIGAVRVYTESTRAAIVAQMGMGFTLLLLAYALAVPS